MKKIVFVFLLSSLAFATPENFWEFGTGQGWDVYQIESTNKIEVMISCNVGYGFNADHSVTIYKTNGYKEKEIKGEVTFIINDKVYHIPNSGQHGLPTSTRGGGIAWDDAMMALAKATKFDLYINDKFVARYTPSKRNIKSVLYNENTFCESLFFNPQEY